jgi:hypothetical protein
VGQAPPEDFDQDAKEITFKLGIRQTASQNPSSLLPPEESKHPSFLNDPFQSDEAASLYETKTKAKVDE